MKRIILALYGIAIVVAVLVSEAGADEQRLRRFCRNLVPDPGFESGVSDFYAQGVSPTDPGPSEVMQTAVDPLEGSYSLRIDSRSPGQNFWWIHEPGGTGSYFGVSAHLRSDMDSDSELQFCARAYYADTPMQGQQSFAESCTTVTGTAGDKGVVAAALTPGSGVMNLDSTRPLESVRFRLYQSGREDLQFTMDSATACLNPWEIPLDLLVTPLPPKVYP